VSTVVFSGSLVTLLAYNFMDVVLPMCSSDGDYVLLC